MVVVSIALLVMAIKYFILSKIIQTCVCMWITILQRVHREKVLCETYINVYLIHARPI